MSQRDPTDILNQPTSDKTKERKAERDTENEDFRWLMGSRRGRRIVWRQLERAGVFRISFNQNAMSMAFAEGNRNEGLRIIGMIHSICPELYTTMVKEANDRTSTDSDAGSRKPKPK